MSAQRDSQTDKIFVYGTLRKGFEPHELLRSSARFLGRGRIAGRLYDLGKYPGAIASESPGEAVEGELYELREGGRQLKELDEYEGFDPGHPDESLFVRRRVDVRLETGERSDAWVYLLPRAPAKGRRIPSGDYAATNSVRRRRA